ncbi:MAG: PD-(D/E)XK nuclease family protein [Actinobacteria bacterium]|nr:PD-(D/E)XK nuclease family protein [Actinomycetota bacterium]
MSLQLPATLSPSKVSSFKSCPLAFRLSAIEHLPEAPSAPAMKGTLVHRALEHLFWNSPAGKRSVAAAMEGLEAAWGEMSADPEMAELDLGPKEREAFFADATALVRRYFEMENPDEVTAVGIELSLEASMGPVRLRGIIDRLDLDKDGELVVTDYKTGRSPAPSHEQARMDGVHFYAYLCEQMLGKAPARVRLLYLRDGVEITAEISPQSLKGLRQRTLAVWSAIERACATEDFRPRTSPLCNWCSFKAYCPAFGGSLPAADPIRAEPAEPGPFGPTLSWDQARWAMAPGGP